MNKTLKYYSQNAATFISNTLNVDIKEIQNEFISCLLQGARILDLGCGSGRDTLYFLQKGFYVTALDGCKEFCEATKALCSEYEFKGKIEIQNQDFSNLVEINQYDGVWACSSLLHISKNELPDILKKIECALKEDGVFYCSFKEGNFDGERNGRYFSDFAETELRALIKKSTTLKEIKSWKTLDARPDRSETWLNSLWKKN